MKNFGEPRPAAWDKKTGASSMSKDGKTFTILLIVVLVVLLCLTGIAAFFFNKETALRKSLEQQLVLAKDVETRLNNELQEAKKQVFLVEEKNKEADEKINSLMDELELQEGIRDQMKTENASLKDALTKESQEKEKLQREFAQAQEKVTSLEEKLKAQEISNKPLEKNEGDGAQAVDLDKIVVRPGEIPEGRVVSVNEENDFLIFNLGAEHGIVPNMLLSIYHSDQYLGDIKVARVQDGMSVADFIPPFSKDKVKKDDRVLVKK